MASFRTRNRANDYPEFSTQADHYARLDLSEDATSDQIKRAYRAAMKRIHPDRAPPEDRQAAEQMARDLNEAYRVLTDPAERRKYDADRRASAIQDELMSRYFGGFGVPGGRNDIYEEIMAAAREENLKLRRSNDRQATRALLTMFLLLLVAAFVVLLTWGIVSEIVDLIT